MADTLFTCVKCGTESCRNEEDKYPMGCISVKAQTDGLLSESLKEYETNAETLAIAKASAAVEAEFYCKATRVEEIVHFAKKMNYKKIGLASCIGLIEETRLFAKVLEAADLIPYGVSCKAGNTDKTRIGIPDEDKIHSESFEAMCNPVLQAMIFNQEKTDLNIIIGLCVGHDSLFIKYSEAPVTTLITKDRVLAHNPAGALYTLERYRKQLLNL